MTILVPKKLSFKSSKSKSPKKGVEPLIKYKHVGSSHLKVYCRIPNEQLRPKVETLNAYFKSQRK